MNFKNKTILLIIHQGILGGAERQGLSMSKVLTLEYSCNVYLLLTYSGEMSKEFLEFAEECRVKEIFHFGEPYFLLKQEFTIRNLKRLSWSLKYLFKIKKEISNVKPEIIIPFLNFPSKISYYLYKLLPSVKYTFWHQLGLDTWSDDIFEKIAARHIPLVIANAPNGLEIFNEMYPRSNKDCFVLPQFLSLDHKNGNPELLRKDLNIAEEEIVIIMVAHYRPEKLHGLLIEAFIQIKKEYNNITLIFLGNKVGAKREDLITHIVDLNIEGRIKLLSGYPVSELLSLADIGVLVSEIEGVPNAVMEYMAYGLPVVCTSHPGCKILLGNSEFLIENKVDKLVISLKKLLSSKEMREIEGKRNQERIKTFNKFDYIKKLEGILSLKKDLE